MRINDELLEFLADYFVQHDVYAKYEMTFESFVDRWQRGIFDNDSLR